MRIASINLKNSTSLSFSNFNVFIGGNGVGKSTLLLEMFAKASNITRPREYWINSTNFESQDLPTEINLLKTSLARKYEGANLFYLSQATRQIDGNIDLHENLRFHSSEFDSLETRIDATTIVSDIKCRRPFIAFSSCDARLGLQNEVGKTGHDQPPQDPINVLYRNKQLLKDIGKAINDRFQLQFVLLDHTGIKLELGISREIPPVFDSTADNLQEEFKKIDDWKRNHFVPLTESGHGIRSMIRLLTSLLEPVNQMILIDEPEMHLYPSHKRWLGKQLVEMATKQNKQVFLVTHDPMVLQGILDVNNNTSIFRVERDSGGKGTIRTCEMNKLKDVGAQKNQEQYLQGLFYQRCIVVEGASDRSFYQNLIEEIPSITDKDLGFVAAGGKSSTKHMANIFSKVGVHAAFIYDFDVLAHDADLIDEVYALLGGSDTPVNTLKVKIDSDPEIATIKDPGKKSSMLKKMFGSGLQGTFGIKYSAEFIETINKLADKGIFIVPNGSLEAWAPSVGEKVRFAEQAPPILKADPALQEEFKSFAGRILKFLNILPE